MIVDKLFGALAEIRRRRRVSRALVVTAVAAAILGPSLLPQYFTNATYLLGMMAIVMAGGLTDMTFAFGVTLVMVLADVVMRWPQTMAGADGQIRLTLFIVMAVLTSMGAEAFRRFERRAQATLDELIKSEALMRAIHETGPDAMLVMDIDGVVSRFSPAGEVLFGWSAEEVIGRRFSMLVAQHHRGDYEGPIDRLLDDGERRIVGERREVVGLTRGGVEFPMMLYIGEVRFGEERHFTGFIHDLTALRAADDRGRTLQAELAHVWSMNSLGGMAAVLAHELNQPLGAIANYVRGARSITARLELPDDSLLDALDKAGDQAIRAGEIIRRMRDLLTRNVLERTNESLSSLIREMDFMTELLVREGGVTLLYNLDPGPDDVFVDRIQIQQVIMNLVRNAVEAVRDQPTRLLAISTQRSANSWVVRVEDSGRGLSQAAQARLFQPMQSDKCHGMGLGLSISRTIVESHSGAMWVERSTHGGAAVIFSLPVANSAEKESRGEPDGLRHRR